MPCCTKAFSCALAFGRQCFCRPEDGADWCPNTASAQMLFALSVAAEVGAAGGPGSHGAEGWGAGLQGALGVGKKCYQGEAEMMEEEEEERGRLSCCLSAKGLRLEWPGVCFPFLEERIVSRQQRKH